MKESDELNPGDREFESALAGINLAETRINRDELAFALGKASVARRLNGWRSISAVLTAVLLISLIGPIVMPSAREDSIASQDGLEKQDIGKPLQEFVPLEPSPFREAAYLSARTAMLDDDLVELDEFFTLHLSSNVEHPGNAEPVSLRSLRKELPN
ncbi:hypothetical protein N9B94_01950 [Verrucomicrobia bacterium]|nr:hypothetical protein [Verrucomicrobiota bacterium]